MAHCHAESGMDERETMMRLHTWDSVGPAYQLVVSELAHCHTNIGFAGLPSLWVSVVLKALRALDSCST